MYNPEHFQFSGVFRDRFRCDNCSECPIQGNKWKCNTCMEHWLCSSCYNFRHLSSLPAQCQSFTMETPIDKTLSFPAADTGYIQPDLAIDMLVPVNQKATNSKRSSDNQHVMHSNLHRSDQLRVENHPLNHSSSNLAINSIPSEPSDMTHTDSMSNISMPEDIAKPNPNGQKETQRKRKRSEINTWPQLINIATKSKLGKESYIGPDPEETDKEFEPLEQSMDMEPFTTAAVSTEGTHCTQDSAHYKSLQTDHDRLFQMDKASSTFLCIDHIHGNCNQSNCARLHSNKLLPYLWQLKLFGDWVTLPEFESVEQVFCKPEEKAYSCKLVYASVHLSYTIVFGRMITASIRDDAVNDSEARRLTTMSFKEAGDAADSYATQWRWYWKDNDGFWNLFEPDSLQHTLEAKFLAKQPTYQYSRENYKWEYVIDLESMTQQNMTTGATRKLRRRPLFVSHKDVQDKRTPPCLEPPQLIDVQLPTLWMPWDVAHPFELVQLSHTDTAFIEVSENFHKTICRDRFILAAVFRIQNHALWSAFCNHEKTMLNNQRRLGDRNPVDKRNLFHGTDSLDTVRGICINNFDFRLCGKNATMYGQGAYFARDAQYSHKFTFPSEKLDRFMFQARVLVGYYTKGEHEYKRPPEKPGKDHELYDSCVDSEDDPSIFILFEKNAYYPEYLIRYKYTGDTDVSTSQPVMSINVSPFSSSLASSAVQQAPPPPPKTTKKSPSKKSRSRRASKSSSSVPSSAVQLAPPPTFSASLSQSMPMHALNSSSSVPLSAVQQTPTAQTITASPWQSYYPQNYINMPMADVHTSHPLSSWFQAPQLTASSIPAVAPPRHSSTAPQPFTYPGTSSSFGNPPPAHPGTSSSFGNPPPAHTGYRPLQSMYPPHRNDN